ncbi:hypothetical protein E2320_012790 [Naja naja]|nr:hypothetical protein E2320_012790 [Naja naja]
MGSTTAIILLSPREGHLQAQRAVSSPAAPSIPGGQSPGDLALQENPQQGLGRGERQAGAGSSEEKGGGRGTDTMREGLQTAFVEGAWRAMRGQRAEKLWARGGSRNEKADSGIWRQVGWGRGSCIPAVVPLSGARKAHKSIHDNHKGEGSRSIVLENRDQLGECREDGTGKGPGSERDVKLQASRIPSWVVSKIQGKKDSSCWHLLGSPEGSPRRSLEGSCQSPPGPVARSACQR